MLLEPRAPLDRELGAGLQHRGHAPRAAAGRDAGVAAVLGGQHLEDRGALAMAAHREQQALVAPGGGHGQSAAAIISISTRNSGRVKPETITRVEAGGVGRSVTKASRAAM